jgi:hypothetical protein
LHTERKEKDMFEAIFRIGVQVETGEQGQPAFPVTKQRPQVNESEFLALLASVYQEQVYPALRAGDDLTVTAHLDAPARVVERTFRFREDRLFEGEGLPQPVADLLPLVQGVYEHFVQQVGPGDVFTLTFHIEHP